MIAPLLIAVVALSVALQEPSPPSREVGEHTQPIVQLVVSPDGRYLYTGAGQHAVHAFDLKKDEVLWKIETKFPLSCFDLGEDWLAYTTGSPIATQLSTETGEVGKQAASPNYKGRPTCIAGDSKDRWVWIGADDGLLARMTPHNPSTGWSTRSMKNGGVRCLARDPKDKLLAVGGEDKTIRFLNPQSASRDEKTVFEGHEAPVTAVCFDGKGSTLISGSEDGVLRIWKMSNGKCTSVLEEHAKAVTALATNAKSKWLASGDKDGKIVVWDLKKAEALVRLEGRGAVVGLAFLGKRAELAAVTGDRVTIWDLSEL